MTRSRLVEQLRLGSTAFALAGDARWECRPSILTQWDGTGTTTNVAQLGEGLDPPWFVMDLTKSLDCAICIKEIVMFGFIHAF